MDSNHRRLSQQIYSLPPLATWVTRRCGSRGVYLSPFPGAREQKLMNLGRTAVRVVDDAKITLLSLVTSSSRGENWRVLGTNESGTRLFSYSLSRLLLEMIYHLIQSDQSGTSLSGFDRRRIDLSLLVDTENYLEDRNFTHCCAFHWRCGDGRPDDRRSCSWR